MADAMLSNPNIHKALFFICTHIPFCFLSLILAASATKWLACFSLERITLQSALSAFHLSLLGLCAEQIHHKGTRYAF